MNAPLATPNEAYAQKPTRWGAISTVITNKKALDAAMQYHEWEVQKAAASEHAAMARTKVAGTFDLARQKMSNDTNRMTPESQARAATIAYVKDKGIELQDPAQQEVIGQVYQFYLKQFSGGAASMAGGRIVNPAGTTPGPEQPSMFVNPFTADRENSVAAQWSRPQAGTPAAVSRPAGAPPSMSGTQRITAINPKTKQRMEWKDGQWVALTK
jgi:hypothetical protein